MRRGLPKLPKVVEGKAAEVEAAEVKVVAGKVVEGKAAEVKAVAGKVVVEIGLPLYLSSQFNTCSLEAPRSSFFSGQVTIL